LPRATFSGVVGLSAGAGADVGNGANLPSLIGFPPKATIGKAAAAIKTKTVRVLNIGDHSGRTKRIHLIALRAARTPKIRGTGDLKRGANSQY
jgi:hypothetical protein